MLNGDGLRVVLLLSGCSHNCYKCQNPQTHDPNSGILFDEKAEEELFRELSKDYISGLTLTGGDPLHENNLDGVLNLVNKIRLLLPEKSIWLYTGYTIVTIMPYKLFALHPNIMSTNPTLVMSKNPSLLKDKELAYEIERKRSEIINKCDVVIDGRYIDTQRDVSLKWRGSSNQRVIDVKKSLRENKITLYCD
jgi:anaerobic ribonucleoside-triphosphate reductase activating protein